MLTPLVFRRERRTRRGPRQFVGYGTVPGVGRVKLFQTAGTGIERALDLVRQVFPDLVLPPGGPLGSRGGTRRARRPRGGMKDRAGQGKAVHG